MEKRFKKYQRILRDGMKDTVLVSIELNAVVAYSKCGSDVLIPCEPKDLPFNLQPDYVADEKDIPYLEIPSGE